MKACSLYFLKVTLIALWALLIEVPNVSARRITATQVQKAPPDDKLLDYEYEVTEDDISVDISIQRWTDTSTEWIDDGCINLKESGDDWLLETITYSPARANPSHPYFLDSILVFNQHFCEGEPLRLDLGDFTDERDFEPGSPWIRPWENPRNGGVKENPYYIPGTLNSDHKSLDVNFKLELPEKLPERDLPENVCTPLREGYTDELQFDLDTAVVWHQASALSGLQYMANLVGGKPKAEAMPANKPQVNLQQNNGKHGKYNPGSKNYAPSQYDDEYFDQIREFGRDISLFGYWGPVSIRFVTDCFQQYKVNLGREVL
ncbi:hypothetical protein TWF506_006800 [Arthrobotrys conoides]|uniref:Uncharacterized protein n=1 Tax=Arthrobotrys conoides TaxID=74498 RepID=A0AAN8S1H9_9PEZI